MQIVVATRSDIDEAVMGRKVVFLFDVDNTLLDNDRIAADLKAYLEGEVGHERQQRSWTIFEQLRAEVGYADYLGALQLYRANYPRDLNLLAVSHFLLEYPFADRFFPGALDAVRFAVEGPTPPANDPSGNSRVAISATTKINRKDFGLTWNAALETGGILVGDEVTITLEVEFVKA